MAVEGHVKITELTQTLENFYKRHGNMDVIISAPKGMLFMPRRINAVDFVEADPQVKLEAKLVIRFEA